MLVLSGLAPAITVFLYVPVLFWVSGNFSLTASLIGALVVVAMGFVYAEVGSAFPVAGSEYAMISRVLGRPLGFVIFLAVLVFFVLLISTYALGVGLQLQTVWSTLPEQWVGLGALILAAALSLLNIQAGLRLTAVILCLQVIAIAVVTILGFANASDPAVRLFDYVSFAPDGSVVPLTWSVVLLAFTLGFFNQTGFNNVCVFSEETEDARRRVVKAIFIVITTVIIVINVPLMAALLGAPSLKELCTAPAPMSYLMESLGAGRLGTFVNLAVAAAMFNGLIVLIMTFGRVLWAGARDTAFPGPLSRALSVVHPRFRSPWLACFVMAALSVVGVFYSGVQTLVTLQGVITLLFMGLMSIASLRLHWMKGGPSHWKMPLWPLPPLFALAMIAVMATGQTLRDLYIILAIAAVALVYYLLYLRPRRESHWVMLGAVDESELDAPGAAAPETAGAS